MQALIEYASYMPHGYCLFWQPWLVALYAGSDLLIFLAYAAIPFALLRVLRQRPDLKYRGIVALFAAFILLCGITHAISILTLWIPVYPLHGAVKLVTGLVSAATAVTLFVLVPKLVAIPSPAQLEAANARLRAEIAAHEETLAALRETQRTLEERVARRTAELSQANLHLEVTTREAVHRGKNLLAVVSAIARQTAAGAGADLAAFMERFMGRINALAVATASVSEAGDDTARPGVGDILRRQLLPVTAAFGDRVTVDGPRVDIRNEAAQHFALMAHELATNSIKHGSLSQPGGTVAATWTATDGRIDFHWGETFPGPAPELPDGAQGFGMKLLLKLLPGMLGGTADLATGEGRLDYRLSVPLRRLAREGDDLRDIDVGQLVPQP